MTDALSDASPTPPAHDRYWRVPVLVGLVVLAIVVAVALLVGRDDDEDPAPAAGSSTPATPSESPTTATTSTGSASPSASPSPTETPTADEPVRSPIVDKAVRGAIKAGFPALVPAGIPSGWTVTAAAYSPKGGGSWRIDLTEPGGGEVMLVQSTQSLEAAVATYLGRDAEPAGKVDLRDFGTGLWNAYESAGHAGIGKKLSSTSVLVHGPDQATLVTLAQELVTAEDYDVPEAG